MNEELKTHALSGAALGLIGLCFLLLLQEVVISEKQWQEVPRIFAGLLAPVPPAIFLAFCFAHREIGAPLIDAPVRMTVLLLGAIVVTIALGFVLRGDGRPDIDASNSAPAIAESAVFSGSVMNFLFFRSALLASALCGISIGLTIFVIFLT